MIVSDIEVSFCISVANILHHRPNPAFVVWNDSIDHVLSKQVAKDSPEI
ncbi:MAG: hypothetical protein RLZ76_696, partial [Bacteroidota bacterium]